MSAKYIGELVKVFPAVAPYNIVAGGTNDNTEKTGTALERTSFKGGKLAIVITATLAQSATAIVKSVKLTHSDTSGGTYTDFWTEKTNVITLTGGTGGSTENGVYQIILPDLESAKAYIKVAVTTDLSAANTDTAVVAPVLVLGGSRVDPVA